MQVVWNIKLVISMTIYLDNAATTQLDSEVLESMLPYMTKICGNASSVHRYGNYAKVAIEKARKKIAHIFQVAPAEILFTSGGTEGNNLLLSGTIEAMHINNVLTSPLEHLSVRMPLERLAQQGKIKLSYVPIHDTGAICLDFIKNWLIHHEHSLLSFMQVNHEIGNITDITAIAALCKQYCAILHSDTIQSLYCCNSNFHSLSLDLGVASAHKIHGPQGIGFVYIAPEISIVPLILGGHQELNRRGGTENVAHIVGMAKAVEISFRDKEQIVTHVTDIKQYMIQCLRMHIPDVVFNGKSESLTESSPTLLNISLPSCKSDDMLIYHLDIHGIAASTGSACTSGSNRGSEVIAALNQPHKHAIRFSFSKHTTKAEVEQVVSILSTLCL